VNIHKKEGKREKTNENKRKENVKCRYIKIGCHEKMYISHKLAKRSTIIAFRLSCQKKEEENEESTTQ